MGNNLLAVIKLELIGDNFFAYQRQAKERHRPTERYSEYLGKDKSRPWVAHLIGLDTQYGFKREFLKGQKDYSQANSVGSRGVYLYFPLKDGIYEVNERLTWKRARRYFIRVQNAQIVEIGRDEVLECLTSTI